jgi:flagellar basal body-associated protein FliL
MKKIILISISVALLLASAYVVYSYFFSDGSVIEDTTTQDQISALKITQQKVLPYGEDLDFSEVQKFNKRGVFFNYPAVGPADLGVANKDLFIVGSDK